MGPEGVPREVDQGAITRTFSVEAWLSVRRVACACVAAAPELRWHTRSSTSGLRNTLASDRTLPGSSSKSSGRTR
eukprot:1046407-Rhodomonas_salina.2